MKKLVVLGASTTALGVIWNAHGIGIESILVDRREDIATYSALCRSIILSTQNVSSVVNEITKLGEGGKNYLIATSDEWVKFIIANREALEIAYRLILHATNEALSVCLDKQLFVEWCGKHEFPVPKEYALPYNGQFNKDSFQFPLFIRPKTTAHEDANTIIPKAVEVNDLQALEDCLQLYKTAGREPLLTESLLNKDLKQYSVVVTNNGQNLMSFVAEKIRPYANKCAVGTYVVLSPNRQVEELGRRLIQQLDYYGIAEVEILHCIQSGKNYLIEINPRPWLQYSLALKSGHDLLSFLLQPNKYDQHQEIKKGKRWIDFRSDFYTCFSKNGGLVRNGSLSLPNYLFSILRANAFAKFSISDLKPFIHDFKLLIRMII